MILHRAEDLEGVVILIESAAEPTRNRSRDVALPPAEDLELVLTLEQVAGVVAGGDEVGDHLADLAHEGPLEHGLDRLSRDERDRLPRIELGEVILEIG